MKGHPGETSPCPSKTCQIQFASDRGQLRSVDHKQVWCFLHTSLLLDQIHLTKTWQAIQIRSLLILYVMIGAFFERIELNQMQEVGSDLYDPAPFWLYAGDNDHNWPQPKHFWTGSGMFIGLAPTPTPPFFFFFFFSFPMIFLCKWTLHQWPPLFSYYLFWNHFLYIPMWRLHWK